MYLLIFTARINIIAFNIIEACESFFHIWWMTTSTYWSNNGTFKTSHNFANIMTITKIVETLETPRGWILWKHHDDGDSGNTKRVETVETPRGWRLWKHQEGRDYGNNMMMETVETQIGWRLWKHQAQCCHFVSRRWKISSLICV